MRDRVWPYRSPCFAFDDFPSTVSVTVMIRPAADETMHHPRWAAAGTLKQARHTSQMDRFRMRGEELAVEAPSRPSGRDGVMASPPPPRRRWLLEGGGAAFQHMRTASTVMYDQAEHCATVPYAYEPGLIRTDSQVIDWGWF